MTTPERLRRRQRREGFAVIVIGLGLIFQQWYFGNRADDAAQANAATNECIARQFSKLSAVLSARSDLAQRESNAVADVLVTAANATNGDQVAAALRRYDRERRAIAKARKDNPLPKFPTGRCDKNGPGAFPLREGIHSPPGVPAPDRGRVDGVATEAVAGAADAIRRATRDNRGDRQRQPDPATGSSPGGRPVGSGPDRGGSGSGGGGLEPGGGLPETDPVETLTGVADEVMAKTTPTVQKVVSPPITATAEDDEGCEGDDG